jgi:predicted aspartyl protease
MLYSNSVKIILLMLATAASANAKTINTPIESSGYGTYRIETSLGEMLIDTGSSYLVLTPETQRKVKIHQKQLINAKLANGKATLAEQYIITEIKIGNCLIENVKSVTFSTGTTNILGMSALIKMSPLTINTKTNNITFNCNGVPHTIKCRGCSQKYYQDRLPK